MSETNAQIGYGVKLQRLAVASPESWEDIGEFIEVGGPKMARDAVEATHSLSTARYREFISGLRDAGEATAQLALVPGAGASVAHKKLLVDFESNSKVTYRILLPNAKATAWEFEGLITSMEHAMPIADRMTVSVSIKASGQPTLLDTVP